MNHRRRVLPYITLGWAALAGTARMAVAQTPKRLTVLVGFPPGGGPDLVARAVSEAVRAGGTTVVVENRTGATGRLAAEALHSAPADGSTIMLVPGGNLTIHPHIYRKLRYDPLKDFVPLAAACEFPFGIAVGPSVPAKTLGEFVAWAKANPGKAAFGTPGSGTGMHFLGVMLGREARIDLQHVPYSTPMIPELIGGSLPAGFLIVPILKPLHQGGKVRILAVSSDARVASLPDVPTFKESGFPGLTLSETFLFVARAQTPAAVQQELVQMLAGALESKAVKTTLETANFNALSLPQDAVALRLKNEHARWGEIVKATGYTPED